MSDMTAAQLHEIVKPLPEKWWPDGMKWCELWQDGVCHVRCFKGRSGVSMDPNDVHRVFIGHLDACMDDIENHWATSRDNEGVTIYSMCMGSEMKQLARGRTRLHALVACFAAKEARDA